jgi:DNA-binding CsgD family transcriptional regulator
MTIQPSSSENVCHTPRVQVSPTGGVARPVGRAGEIEAASRAFLSGSHLVIAAGPGLGSTSLARYVTTDVARPVRLVQAHRGTPAVPLGALAPLVGSPEHSVGVGADLLARATRRLVPDPHAPPIVVVDQAHDLDELSASALAAATAQGLTLVLTTGRRSTLDPALSALLRSAPAIVMDLRPIDDASVSRLGSEILGAPIDPALVRALTRHVGGAPAAIVDVLSQASVTGCITQLGSMWRLTDELPVPRVLALRADRVLRELDEAALTTVDVLAICDRMRYDAVATVVGTDALDHVHDQGLLEHLDDGTVRLRDPLLRTVRLAQLAQGRRQRLARQLHQVVIELGIEDVILQNRLALHSGVSMDRTMLMAGARAAWRQGDSQLAERLCRLGADENDLPAMLVLGEMLTAIGRAREADALLSAVATDDVDLFVLARQARVVNLAYHLDDVSASLAVLDETLAMVAGSQWSNELLGLRAVITLMQGRPAEALAEVDHLLDGGTGRSYCQAVTAAAPSLVMLGRPLEAATLATRALEERLRLGDVPILAPAGLHAVVQAFGLAEAGLFGEADLLSQRLLAETVANADREGQMWVGVLHGRSLLDQGRYDEALQVFEWAATAATDISLVPHLRWARGGALLAAAQMRDEVATRHAVDALDACPPTGLALMAPDIARARAWARVMQGDLTRAVETLRQAATLARDSGETLLEMLALYDLVRLGTLGDVPRLQTLGESMQGELPACRADHGVAAAAGHVDGLEAVSERLESLGAIVLAAEAANQAAWIARRGGSSNRSERLRARVLELRSRRPRASTPALDLRPNTAFLTPREREVAELATVGWPSKTIAEHLHVSVRTVDNLLQRVYRKLGIRGRAELRSPDMPAAPGLAHPTSSIQPVAGDVRRAARPTRR